MVPFFIDWGDSPHPADDAQEGCSLSRLTLSYPEAWSLRPLLEKLEVDVEVQAGEAAITAELQTPKGVVRLSSLDQVSG